MITCPDCEEQFNAYIDEEADDEEYGPRVECPECGVEFDPTTA